MFENKIKFLCLKEYLEFADHKPEPVSLNLPEWYKKLEHTFKKMTVKGCLPFMDTLTTGYLIRTSQDYYVDLQHNPKAKDDEDKWHMRCVPAFAVASPSLKANAEYLGLDISGSTHDYTQLEGSKFMERNLARHFIKFDNPWYIETPPGYSCLFVPPLNNGDDRFECLAGIVDTDTHYMRINFPSVFNGWKYKNGYKGTIKKGTPLVQVIPFKRESWKMEIGTVDKKEVDRRGFKMTVSRFKYIRSVWHKKITK